MTLRLQDVPEQFRGQWCDERLAEQVRFMDDDPEAVQDKTDALRLQWADAVLSGDTFTAHRLWAKWQGSEGFDPWEDEGWRNYWMVNRFGPLPGTEDESPFGDASESVTLHTYLSYWDGDV
jgi:hypothetical protein